MVRRALYRPQSHKKRGGAHPAGFVEAAMPVFTIERNIEPSEFITVTGIGWTYRLARRWFSRAGWTWRYRGPR